MVKAASTNHGLSGINEKIALMGREVGEMLALSMTALVEHNSASAREAIAQDKKINRLEAEIDTFGFRCLPSVQDLQETRMIVLALKITRDLERIGDLIVNVAERTLELNEQPQLKPYVELPKMMATVEKMIRESLRAFIEENPEKAKKVYDDYKGIAQWRRSIFYELLDFMITDPTTVARSIRLISIARYLERIGDHAADIAELVVYGLNKKMIRG